MRQKDITPLIKKYGPGYVAKNQKTGTRDDVIISWIPKQDARYVFQNLYFLEEKIFLNQNSTY